MIQQPVQHDYNTAYNAARTNGLTVALIIYWSTGNAYENKSHITIALWARTELSSSTTGKSWTGYIKIGDNTKTLSGYDAEKPVASSYVHMFSYDDVEFSHNIDGSSTVSIAASLTGPTGTSLQGVTCGGDFDLTIDPIDRHATFNDQTVGVDMPFAFIFNEYDRRFTTLLSLTLGGTEKFFNGYHSGDTIVLNTSELLDLYSTVNPGVTSTTIPVRLTTFYQGESLGEEHGIIHADFDGTAHVRVNGTWKSATPYVRVNGVWKRAVANTRVNGVWKRNY